MNTLETGAKLNVLLFLFFAALSLLSYIALPLWLLPMSQGWAWLLLPVALGTTANWALIHDGIHRVLHPGRRVNEGLSRVMSICFGSPLRILRFGHLMHHRFNRTALDRTEVYDPARASVWRVWPLYYFRLFGGLYMTELVGGLLFLLPRRRLLAIAQRLYPADSQTSRPMLEQITRDLLTPAALREIRLDAVASWGLLILAFTLYGEHWHWLAGLLLVRGALVSLVDNSFHYGTPLDEVRYSYNLRLPAWAGPLVLNFNYHRVHHQYPRLAWYMLPGRFASTNDSFEHGFLSGVLRQIRGPLSESELPPDSVLSTPSRA